MEFTSKSIASFTYRMEIVAGSGAGYELHYLSYCDPSGGNS